MSKLNNKKHTIMANIQKLRNEIEEIRIQNLSLIDAIKPYEKWYEETEEILFSTSRINKKAKIHKNHISKFLYPEDSDLSLSTSSDDSESDKVFQKEDSGKSENNSDEEYQEPPQIMLDKYIENNKNNTELAENSLKVQDADILTINKPNNTTTAINFSNKHHDFISNQNYSKHSTAFQDQFNPNTKNLFISRNETSNKTINTSNNQSYLQQKNQSTNYLLNQQVNYPTISKNIPLNYSNSFHQTPYQNYNYSFLSNQSCYQNSTKISQIGTNSMLSNAVFQQKKLPQDRTNQINYQPDKALNNAPLYRLTSVYPDKLNISGSIHNNIQSSSKSYNKNTNASPEKENKNNQSNIESIIFGNILKNNDNIDSNQNNIFNMNFSSSNNNNNNSNNDNSNNNDTNNNNSNIPININKHSTISFKYDITDENNENDIVSDFCLTKAPDDTENQNDEIDQNSNENDQNEQEISGYDHTMPIFKIYFK